MPRYLPQVMLTFVKGYTNAAMFRMSHYDILKRHIKATMFKMSHDDISKKVNKCCNVQDKL